MTVRSLTSSVVVPVVSIIVIRVVVMLPILPSIVCLQQRSAYNAALHQMHQGRILWERRGKPFRRVIVLFGRVTLKLSYISVMLAWQSEEVAREENHSCLCKLLSSEV